MILRRKIRKLLYNFSLELSFSQKSTLEINKIRKRLNTIWLLCFLLPAFLYLTSCLQTSSMIMFYCGKWPGSYMYRRGHISYFLLKHTIANNWDRIFWGRILLLYMWKYQIDVPFQLTKLLVRTILLNIIGIYRDYQVITIWLISIDMLRTISNNNIYNSQQIIRLKPHLSDDLWRSTIIW